MSFNSFLDSIDTDTQFDVWKKTITQKLVHLKNIIPVENRDELNYIGETLQFLNKLTPLNSSYVSTNPDTGNKEELIKRLKKCNSFYKKLGD